MPANLPAPTLAQVLAAFPNAQLLTNAEGPGGKRGHGDPSGRTETLVFKVDWTDYENFLGYILGGPQSFGTGSAAKIVRQIPMVYPYNPRLYAVAFDSAASNANKTPSLRTMGQSTPYASQVVTITFGTLPFIPDATGQPYIGVRTRGGFEVRTIPGLGLAFSSGEKIDQDFGRLVGTKTIEVVRYQIPDLDAWIAVADPLMGYVNSAGLAIRSTTYAAGTVLFVSYDSDEQKTSLGIVQQQITLQFLYNSIPWNSAIRSDGVIDTYTPAVIPPPTSRPSSPSGVDPYGRSLPARRGPQRREVQSARQRRQRDPRRGQRGDCDVVQIGRHGTAIRVHRRLEGWSRLPALPRAQSTRRPSKSRSRAVPGRTGPE